jgi:hypothetical protein
MPKKGSTSSKGRSQPSPEVTLKLELKQVIELQGVEGSRSEPGTKINTSEVILHFEPALRPSKRDTDPDDDPSVPQSHEFKGTLGEYGFILILEELRHPHKP